MGIALDLRRTRLVVGVSDRQTTGMEGAKSTSIYCLRLSPFESLVHMQSAGRVQILHSATRTVRVLWAMVYIYTNPVLC